MADKRQILFAAKALNIPAGRAGLWLIEKTTYKIPVQTVKGWLPLGTYTHLFHTSLGRLHLSPPGEVVMEDTPFELIKHLDFMMRAHGRVLVTGLGLGCVVRGLLANEQVSHITCIERSADVLSLVQPYMPTDRLTIIQADALEWTEKNTAVFDCAWHDVWTNREEGEPHLDAWHMRLLINCHKFVAGWQGAWAFNRDFRQALKQKGLRVM